MSSRGTRPDSTTKRAKMDKRALKKLLAALPDEVRDLVKQAPDPTEPGYLLAMAQVMSGWVTYKMQLIANANRLKKTSAEDRVINVARLEKGLQGDFEQIRRLVLSAQETEDETDHPKSYTCKSPAGKFREDPNTGRFVPDQPRPQAKEAK